MWVGPPAAAADGQAEAERLQEEIRSLARQSRWDGVELAWHELVATGVPPIPEACQDAADAAQQLGHLIDVPPRLACAPDLPENRDRLAFLRGSTTRVALFGPALVPAQMPFQPDAALAIRGAQQALGADGFWFGLLPVGRYTLGAATLALEPGTTLVARSSGEVAQSDERAGPHLGPFGGRWLDVPLTLGQTGAAVRSVPDAAGPWRLGGNLEAAGLGATALGIASAIAGISAASKPYDPYHPRSELAPIASEAGVGIATLGVVAFALGTQARSGAADRAADALSR